MCTQITLSKECGSSRGNVLIQTSLLSVPSPLHELNRGWGRREPGPSEEGWRVHSTPPAIIMATPSFQRKGLKSYWVFLGGEVGGI